MSYMIPPMLFALVSVAKGFDIYRHALFFTNIGELEVGWVR